MNFYEWLLGKIFSVYTKDMGDILKTTVSVCLTPKQWHICKVCAEEIEEAVLSGYFPIPGVDLLLVESTPLHISGVVYGEAQHIYILELVVTSVKESVWLSLDDDGDWWCNILEQRVERAKR
jgi:hypothetical protein